MVFDDVVLKITECDGAFVLRADDGSCDVENWGFDV